MSTEKDKELICYRVQRDHDADDNEGIIAIAVNDVIEVRRSDLPDEANEEHPQGTFWKTNVHNYYLLLGSVIIFSKV